MGRADFAVVLTTGVEVVVEAVEAGAFEQLGFGVVEQAGGDADFQARVIVFNLADEALKRFDPQGIGASAGEDHAIALGPGFIGFLRFEEDLFVVFDRVVLDVCFAGLGLRAVRAVLGAVAVLGVVQNMNGDIPAPVGLADLVRGGDQLVGIDRFVGQHGQAIGVGGQFVVEGVL